MKSMPYIDYNNGEAMNKKQSAFVAGLLAGIMSPAAICAPHDYPALTGTNTERLRQNVERVSKEIKTIIERENGKSEGK